MICGVDVGKTGAIAFVYGDDFLTYHRTPTLNILKNGKKRFVYNLAKVWEIFRDVDLPKLAIIENLHAFPKQGGVSNFTLGFGLGMFEAMLSGLSIPYEKVNPATWKKHFGLIKQPKQASVVKVNQMFPHLALDKNDHGVADAILLAVWGREK